MNKKLLFAIQGGSFYTDGTYQYEIWQKHEWSEWKLEDGVFYHKDPCEIGWTKSSNGEELAEAAKRAILNIAFEEIILDSPKDGNGTSNPVN